MMDFEIKSTNLIRNSHNGMLALKKTIVRFSSKKFVSGSIQSTNNAK